MRGVLVTSWPETTLYGKPVTFLLIGNTQVWAHGHRRDLLALGLLGREVEATWCRYEGGTRLYLDGPLTLVKHHAGASCAPISP